MSTVRGMARAGLFAGSAFYLLLVGCAEEAPPPELPPRAIQWERVTSDIVTEQRIISGIVTAVEDTKLAFEVGGLVEAVDVALGDIVQKDQVLARLDPEPLELVVREAEASLTEADALLEVARTSLARYQQAAKTNAVAPQVVDEAVAVRDSRESQVEAAEARLNLVQPRPASLGAWWRRSKAPSPLGRSSRP